MTNVLKASGEIEAFSQEKVRDSMRRAGIPNKLEDQILKHIETKLYDRIPTSEIFRHITEFLKTSPSPYSKSRYSLKQAIMDLGPTGFPFEDFVSEILKTEGWKTSVRQILEGECITHEIDVVASKEDKKIMVECKFHNRSGTKSDVHVSLYTKARFDDVREKNNINEAWLVTNTKVTLDGLAYAACNNMTIISWTYPERNSLRDLIEKYNLYPITVLQTLSQSQKQKFLDRGIVLCKTICKNLNLINDPEVPGNKRKNLKEEVDFVCGLG